MKSLNYAIGALSVLILSLLIGGAGAFWYAQERVQVVEQAYEEILSRYEGDIERLQDTLVELKEEVAQEVASNQQLQERTLIPPVGYNRYTHPTGVSFVYPQITEATIEEREGPHDIVIIQTEEESKESLVVQVYGFPLYGHRVTIFDRDMTQLVEPYVQQVLMPAFNMPSTCELERTMRNGVEVYMPIASDAELSEGEVDPCIPPTGFTGFIYNSQKPNIIVGGILGQNTTFSYGFKEFMDSITIL